MNPQEIRLSDWQRILIGRAPLEFMGEVFLRTLFIYLMLLIALRLLGKRMNGQLTIIELAIMITLGAIVSVPMQIPERGLLPGTLLLVCILIFQRGMSWLALKSEAVARVTQGRMSILVKDGCIELESLRRSRVSQQQLFALLRARGIRHLGEVRRVYLEACGNFSIFRNSEPRAGLSILPPSDERLLHAEPSSEKERACVICGSLAQMGAQDFICSHCGHRESVPAIR